MVEEGRKRRRRRRKWWWWRRGDPEVGFVCLIGAYV